MVANNVKGWGQPLFADTGSPRTTVWHGFTDSGYDRDRPQALCGEAYDAVSPLRAQGHVSGEICYYCRLTIERHLND